MNINFKTHFPWPGADGKPEPTWFKEQILNALDPSRISGDFATLAPEQHEVAVSVLVTNQLDPAMNGPGTIVIGKKLHTIRRIKNGKARFREGMKLTFSTGPRFTPERFGEAVCTGVQRVYMMLLSQGGGLSLDITIRRPDRPRILYTVGEFNEFATNDGLRPLDFTKWFMLDLITNGPGEYQIVHWTDLRY